VDVSSVRDVTITEASTTESALSVGFSDGHKAEFGMQWVASMARAQASKAAVAYAPSVTPRSPELLIPEPMELWGAERAAGGPTYMPFSDIVAGGTRTLGVLEAISKDGVVVLEDCGTEDESLWQLGQALGYPQRTHYGDTFHVMSKAVPDSLANTGHALTFHTDLAYRGEPPAFQLLHCQQNDANGGASILADGFQAAVDLLHDDPEVRRTGSGMGC
jgi:gamma-butyrobetaine dioxygenase